MLTLTLRHLEREGIISRTAYAEVLPRVECALASLGESLRETVLALARWVTDHHDEIETARHRYGIRWQQPRRRGPGSALEHFSQSVLRPACSGRTLRNRK
ncbi:helix-turn-helix domain-containing protein [Streptomyces sp. NPDC050704]|uniref:winged helix-turn-helix transcriptional regulator n=1 Tax=Streptomyces sp. NPDC050704 TaxID=3157219 RepID=UPI00343D1061